ncbi:MAG: hypothetical protein ACOCUV_03135 [bacterium]
MELLFITLTLIVLVLLSINYMRAHYIDIGKVNNWVKDASDKELIDFLKTPTERYTLSSWKADKHNRRIDKAVKELRRRGYNFK